MGVTPPKPKDNLAAAAARLSKTSPNTWGEFLDALGAYSRDRVNACVLAPADNVLIAQGMARQVNELLALLTDAAKQK